MRDSRDSFNGGELSDWIDSRTDLYKRAAGCRTLKNAHVVRYGGARRRSGFRLAGEAKAAEVRLEGFNFSRESGIVLEFSNLALRFWNRDGSQILDTGSPLELVTPYLAAELFELDFAQKNDVIIITHPNHLPKCLKHYADDDWSLEDIDWRTRPWSDLNETDTTVTLSKPASTILATFSEDTLDASWIGSYLRIYRELENDLYQTSFYEVWSPSDFGGLAVHDVKVFNPSAGNYDADPESVTNPHKIYFDETPAVFDSLWRCIADYRGSTDFVTGKLSPADYPAFFEQGIIAIDNIKVAGSWEFETKGNWIGIWQVQRSYDNGTTWKTIATVTSQNDNNSLIQDKELETKPALFRIIAFSSDDEYPASVFFRIIDGQIAQELEITAVNSATEAELSTVTPEYDLLLGEASLEWSDDAFSGKNGYPRATTFHESRLFFAGTDAEPERLWGSKTEGFFNFNFGTEAADAFSFVLNANRYNAIVWIASQQSLLIGTTGGEWSSFTTEGGPMTPEDTNFHLHTHHGSDPHPGLVLSDAAVFVQRQGRKIREFAPSPQGLGVYASPDLTELAEHITRGGIKQLTKRDSPDTELLALRNDGTIAAMIFERSQQIYAWQRWTTGGEIKSLATTYGDAEDDAVFIAVSREIEGTTTTFIEFLSPDGIRAEENNDPANFVSLDHATATLPLPASYEGATVTAQAGFEDLGDFIVGSGGTVAIPGGKTNVLVGFAFETEIEPLPVEVGGNANKTIHNSAHVRVRNSSDFKVGTSRRDQWNTVKIQPADFAPVSLDKVITIPGRNARNSSVVIRKDRPGPLSLISLDLETQTGNL